MITVACVLISGGDYDGRYVEKLRDGVDRNLKGHRFVCLSDVDVPCERIPLEHGWPGWWSKIELFRLPGPLLYFDLDTVIAGDLTEIAGQREPFITLRDFYRGGAAIGSGMMGWDDDTIARSLFNTFSARPHFWMQHIGQRGDQGFIEEAAFLPDIARWQDLVPDQVVSYKVHVRKRVQRLDVGTGEIPKGARVICFHGKPRPHQTELW